MIYTEIKSVRERKGITQAELAERLGMMKPQLCKIEKGVTTPREETLKRIAKALGTTLGKLKSRVVRVDDSVRWRPIRKDCETLGAVWEKVVRRDARLDDAECERDLCRATTVPLVHGYLLQPHSNEILARSLRDSLGVGTAAFSNLVWTLEFANVRIHRIELPEGVPSASWWDQDCDRLVVVLARRQTVERSLFRLAYELGAACLYRSKGGCPVKETKLVKRFLGAFAADFLMPASAIADMVSNAGIRRSDWDLRRLCIFKNHFGVSAETFVIRLDELGLIDRSLRVRLRDELRAFYRRHPDSQEPPPSRTWPTFTRNALVSASIDTEQRC